MEEYVPLIGPALSVARRLPYQCWLSTPRVDDEASVLEQSQNVAGRVREPRKCGAPHEADRCRTIVILLAVQLAIRRRSQDFANGARRGDRQSRRRHQMAVREAFPQSQGSAYPGESEGRSHKVARCRPLSAFRRYNHSNCTRRASLQARLDAATLPRRTTRVTSLAAETGTSVL